jgi:uncharacterized membrane protein YqhA
MSGVLFIGAILLVVGLAFYGLFVSGKRPDESASAGDNWQTDGSGGSDA